MTAPVVVAGGGIAGCALALGLHRAGIACVVCETHPDTGTAPGAFLALAPGGVRALGALGATDAVAAVSTPVTTLRVVDGDGATVTTRPMSGDGGPAHRLLTRGALVTALAATAADRGVGFRYGAGVTAATAHDDGVTVTLDGGARVEASLLVGADGIRSAVRDLVDPGSPPPRPVGQRVYWGTTPVRLLGEPGGFVVHRADTGSFGAFPRADGTWWYFRRDVDDPAPPPDPDPRAAVLAHLPPGGAPARVVGEADSITAVDAHDLPWVERWSAGRTVLVGDAAHAASPATGQGATMALEDAVVLAKALRDNASVDDAVAVYERARRGRTQANVLASAAMSRPDRPPAGARPGEPLDDDAVAAQLDWDVPAR